MRALPHHLIIFAHTGAEINFLAQIRGLHGFTRNIAPRGFLRENVIQVLQTLGAHVLTKSICSTTPFVQIIYAILYSGS